MDVFDLLRLVLQIYQFILLARILLSWVPNVDYSQPVFQLLFDITEPILRPVREMLPPTGGVDFSPMLVLVGIQVLQILLSSA